MSVFDILEPIVAALLVITIVFTLFFRIVNVSGRSMMPTLSNGDKIVISATGYEPQRGDIVVLSGAAGIKETIVKRIIAVGGDTLDINFMTGQVWVNGEVIDEPYIMEQTRNKGDFDRPIRIPEGYVFVMGDNRNHSADSREASVGVLKKEDFVGRAWIRIWPLNSIGVLSHD